MIPGAELHFENDIMINQKFND